MRRNWSIRVKVFICLGLLLLVVAILSGAGVYAGNAYRTLVRSLRVRVEELPPAIDLSCQVAELRITLTRLRELRSTDFTFVHDKTIADRTSLCRDRFRLGLDNVERFLAAYRDRLEEKLRASSHVARGVKEWQTVDQIERSLSRVREVNQDENWTGDLARIDEVEVTLDALQQLAAELPNHLYQKLKNLPHDSRSQYRSLIIGTWIAATAAALILALLVKLFFVWVFRPLRVLIAGSRRVGSGDFDYRIHLDTHDEMAELAEALNTMTDRFQAIQDDLENQVNERTRQVIRGEQLASVGFLAAGVAHEINNPLASIALCAESLESRIAETLDRDEEQQAVIGDYLRMIQTEAFRCKEITEKLLDFSRLGNARRENTDLVRLVRDMIDMIGHLGKYHNRHIELTVEEALVAPVNAQEIKQVVLNLLTNALDSLDDDGRVRVRLARNGPFAELTVSDDGCGMDAEVLKHLFEPFFTRRRSGQGTGLGLSITHRIITEHHGEIEARSDGPGRGSTFLARLPLNDTRKEQDHRSQAA